MQLANSVAGNDFDSWPNGAGVRIVMTNDVGDANHDIDATDRISRRNPSGCGRFRRQPCETSSMSLRGTPRGRENGVGSPADADVS